MTDCCISLVVVAAGSATRMGGVDKIWADVCGRTVVARAVEQLAPAADETIVVVRPQAVERARSELGPLVPGLRIVAGGPQRTDSVLNGLRAVSDPEVIAVHDGARPFASASLLLDGAGLLESFDGAVPAIPVPDTLKRINGEGTVSETLDRSLVRAVQTPQVFRARALMDVYRAYEAGGEKGATDDAALLERAGCRVATFPGSPLNFKITTSLDLEVARHLVSAGGLPA